MQFSIEKTVKWHMGHRVPNHKSKCKSMHGHTYSIKVVVTGDVVDTRGTSDEGMVIDFSDIKSLINKHIYDPLDHACMLYEGDPLVDAMKADHDTELVVVPFIPTAENIAKYCYDILAPLVNAVEARSTRKLERVEIMETPTSVAVYTGEYNIVHSGIGRIT